MSNENDKGSSPVQPPRQHLTLELGGMKLERPINFYPWTVESWQLQEEAVVAAAKEMFQEYKYKIQQEHAAAKRTTDKKV